MAPRQNPLVFSQLLAHYLFEMIYEMRNEWHPNPHLDAIGSGPEIGTESMESKLVSFKARCSTEQRCENENGITGFLRALF